MEGYSNNPRWKLPKVKHMSGVVQFKAEPLHACYAETCVLT